MKVLSMKNVPLGEPGKHGLLRELSDYGRDEGIVVGTAWIP